MMDTTQEKKGTTDTYNNMGAFQKQHVDKRSHKEKSTHCMVPLI